MIPLKLRPRKLNKNGQTLSGNWVEERQVRPYDPEGLTDPEQNAAKLLKNGNKGIFSVNFDDKMKKVSSTKASYSKPKFNQTRIKGLRQELIEKALKIKISQELEAAKEAEKMKVEKVLEYGTIYKEGYGVPGFESVLPTPKQKHDLNTETCVSFWSENADRIHGVSEIKRKEDCFKKNNSFTAPISDDFHHSLHLDINKTIQ